MLNCADDNDDDFTFQPLTSPPLTGTLVLDLNGGIEPIAHRLLELPNGARFRKLDCTLCLPEDLLCTMAMVEKFSDTLECIKIKCEDFGRFHPFSFPCDQ